VVAKSAGEKENSRTYAEKRKEERRAALRDFIQGHHILQEINRDLSRDINETDLPVVRFKTETRLKLLAKVLPDLKAVELTGEGGGAVQFEVIAPWLKPSIADRN